jgi:hypothetical protein
MNQAANLLFQLLSGYAHSKFRTPNPRFDSAS